MATHRKSSIMILACMATAAIAGFAPPVLAEDQAWTCSYQAAAGLKWNGTRWTSASFTAGKPFELIVRDATLTPDTAAMPLSSNPRFVQCPAQKTALLSCFDPSGGWLVFDPKTGRGGLSKLYTAIKAPPNEGSTLSVAPFACTAK